MKLFLDTANREEIRTAVEWGILDGITTNPSLAAKEGRRFEELVGEIAELVDGPASAEVVGEAREEMVPQGKDLAQIADNIVVKVPLTREGIAAGWRLTGLGIPSTSPWFFPRCRRSWRLASAPPSSPPSSGGWTTSGVTDCISWERSWRPTRDRVTRPRCCRQPPTPVGGGGTHRCRRGHYALRGHGSFVQTSTDRQRK